MSETGRFDELFLQVAGQLGGIEPLLDEFFGFLSRKTDFYVEFEPSQRAHMGFPKGVKEKMVLRSLQKYPTIPYQSPSPEKATSSTPGNNSKMSSSSSSTSTITPSAKAMEDTHSLPIPTPSPPEAKRSSTQTIRVTEANTQIPIGNGGIAEHYYWTQTLKEITVYVDLDFQAKGKDIQCLITPGHLTLRVRDQLILNDDFEDKVCVDESMWTISTDSNELHVLSQVIITLDKTRKIWWKHVLINDPEIDTSKVDSTQKISDYDEETQAAIRKIMFEQKQKRLGLVSDESLEDSLLKQAMSSPGSPFLNQIESQNQTEG